MADNRIAYLTPSFYGDFERAKFLAESLEKFMVDDYVHYMVVDKSDVPLFKEIESSRTIILAKEDVLPSWLTGIRIPLPQKNRYARFSFKSWPVRGWHVQQMAKLAVCASLENDRVIMVDSDVFLSKPFDSKAVIGEGLPPLYAKPDIVTSAMPRHSEWLKTASRVLGLPPIPHPGPDYVTPFNFWRPEVVREMRKRIESVCKKDWMVVVARNYEFCEPFVYGTFVQAEGPENCGHRMTDKSMCYSYWPHERISNEEMRQFLTEMPEHCYAVNIQSKSEMPIDSYAYLVRGEDGAAKAVA